MSKFFLRNRNSILLEDYLDFVIIKKIGEGGQMGYGRQRVFGTIGFGMTALLAGYAVDLWSEGRAIKSYTPAFLLVFTFTCFDLLCCTKLEVRSTQTIEKDTEKMLN